MPILILVMTGMMDGMVSVDPQTGAETVMEGFKNVWQIIGAVSGGEQTMSMDITSMCNINMMFFIISIFVCIFVGEDFRSGYAKNLFTVRSKKDDYVVSKTITCFVAGASMIIAFFIGSMIGGAIVAATASLGDSDSEENSFETQMGAQVNSNLSGAVNSIVNKNLNIAPTVIIRPGYKFNIIVDKDLVFKPYSEDEDKN